MKSVTVKQMQAFDKRAIQKYGIPSIALMENAGCAVASDVKNILKKNLRARVCIFCGMGNNAGDGFVIARHLMNTGLNVKVFIVGKASQLKGDAEINFRILRKLKCCVVETARISTVVTSDIKKADVIVDALFGTGLSREIESPFKEIILGINKYAKRIVSVDIPSGLNGTSGKIHGVCVKANRTITFAYAKKGFYIGQGKKYTGRIKIVGIGIPA